MIKVTIEIAGQQLKFAAANFQMEGNDIYITLDENQKTKESIPPLHNEIIRKATKKKVNKKHKAKGLFDPDFFLAIKDPMKRIVSLQNKSWKIRKDKTMTEEINTKILKMVEAAHAEKKK